MSTVGKKRLRKLSIKKAGKNKRRVEVLWEIFSGFDEDGEELWDERSIKCHEEPRETMYDRLGELIPHILPTLEVPPAYEVGLTASGLSLSWDGDGIWSAVITMQKELSAYNSPLILNTPSMPSEAEEGPQLDRHLNLAICMVADEALLYAKGERAQMALFDKYKVSIEVPGRTASETAEDEDAALDQQLDEVIDQALKGDQQPETVPA